ncbi:zinc finger protein OZF-like [Zerene cesonia]|uniref:zinc finger protein OZF-like n=1 Tax=Zerene cesonia TaxID=33412 RepID=UPI0018E507A0|nr:zinc finger protein OZF-like [Zerene cesonia]
MQQLAQICWECCALLRKYQAFQQQVKCCYVELLMCLQSNPSIQPTLARPSHLQIHKDTSISIPLIVKSEFEDDVKLELSDTHCEETFVDELSEVWPEKKVKKKIKKKVKLKKVKQKKEIVPDSDPEPTDFDNRVASEDAEFNEKKCEFSEKNCEFSEKNCEFDQKKCEFGDKNCEFKCDQCVGVFSTEIELKKHLEEHVISEKAEVGRKPKTRNTEALPERPQCVECGKLFSSRKTYRYHLNVLHKGQNRYPCPRCGKVYQWKSNLGRHLRSHKARESGELYCEKCDKSFASVATYRQHVRVSRRHVSESEFTFTCEECGKKFVNKTRLRDHIDWEHLNKIKFRCQLCNKPFKCHTSLYVHLQNVHRNKEKKDNLCHVCGKSYQNAAKLKYHIVAMHTSETPYQCRECDAAFGWYSSLYRHVREVHYKMKVQPKKSKKARKQMQEMSLHQLPAGAPPPHTGTDT